VYERSVHISGARYPALATIHCAVTSNIYGTSVWDLLHVSLLAPRNSEVAARLLENLCTPGINKFSDIAMSFCATTLLGLFDLEYEGATILQNAGIYK
jgi:hypothetical protein